MTEAREVAPLPDFIIAGAMKSGTTSLYSILRKHPDVFMPSLEVGFFDIDDLHQHPDFFRKSGSEWHYHRYSESRQDYIQWYRQLFAESRSTQVIGERSTTYMASQVAPYRIREEVPGARLIFMLRDPVPRAYSNYWHLLRSGEVAGSFENALLYRPTVLFERGLYRPQIDRYLDKFTRDQMLFVLFEEFIENPRACLKTVCEFIGVDSGKLPKMENARHENRGRYPWSRHAQYLINSVLFHGLLNGQRYRDAHLPALKAESLGLSFWERQAEEAVNILFKGLSRLNCSRVRRPEIEPETRDLLKYLYEDRNQGLSSLIDRDLSQWWSTTRV